MVPAQVTFICFEEIYILKIMYLNFQIFKKYCSIRRQRIFPKVVRLELMQNFIDELIWGQTSKYSFHSNVMPADFWKPLPCRYAAQGCFFPKQKHGTGHPDFWKPLTCGRVAQGRLPQKKKTYSWKALTCGPSCG